MDWDLNEDLTLTSLTSASEFDRYQGLEADGTIYQDYENLQVGDIEVSFQEVRLSGNINDRGSWIAGLNFEHTESFDSFLHTYGMSSAIPTSHIRNTPRPIFIYSEQETDTWSAFGSVEYMLTDDLNLTLGLRYTDQERDNLGCANDAGDGTWSTISDEIQFVLQLVPEAIRLLEARGWVRRLWNDRNRSYFSSSDRRLCRFFGRRQLVLESGP